MGSRVMSPASNKAVPSSRGMRAVASPLPWRHRQQHGQPLPLPLAPSPAKPRHAQGERSRGWVEAHLPAPIHPVSPADLSGGGKVTARVRRRRPSCCVASPACCGEGSRVAPAPGDRDSPLLAAGLCQEGALLHTEQGAAHPQLWRTAAPGAGTAQIWCPAATADPSPRQCPLRSSAPASQAERAACSLRGWERTRD